MRTAWTRGQWNVIWWRRSLCAAAFSLVLSVVAAGDTQAAPPLSDAGPILQELSKKAQDASLPEAERVAFVKTLGEWGTAQVREPLLALLKDPLPSIREAAARGLGWERNREAAFALRERVETLNETPAVRAAALDSLGKIGDDSVRQAVVAAINDPDAAVRGAALGALTTGRLVNNTDHISMLRRVAEDRALDLLTRCEAILDLGAAPDRGSAPLLIRVLENEPPIPMPLPREAATQQELVAVRYRQARDVRAWAAKAIGLIEAKEALPLLLKSAEDPDDFFLRITSVEALVNWKAPEAIAVLTRRLGDPFPDVRAYALIGLARIGVRGAVDAVRGRLSDGAPMVRIQAIAALLELGDPNARDDIESLKKRELDPNVRQAIEAALARLAH